MANLKKLIMNSDPFASILQIEFEKMFRKWDEAKEERTGLHASGIIASDSDFCFREQILSFHYKRGQVRLSPGLLAIFMNGWYVHIKWQTLFEQMGIVDSVELTRKSNVWNVSLTPDAVINLLRKKWVVEIKSMNTFQFKHLTGPPMNAVRQCQFYMHILCIPNGIILVEDKNDQNFKIFPIKYDQSVAKPFIERLYKIRVCEKRFMDEGKLPVGICSGRDVRRAQNCGYCKACFASKIDREKMRIV